MEIVIVVSIMGILATISVLGFRKAINHQKLKGEAGKLLSVTKYMTDEARVSKNQISILVDFNNEHILAWIDKNENDVFDNGEIKIDEMVFPSGIDLFTGRFGGVVKKKDTKIFKVFDDGSPDEDVIITIRSEHTNEQRAIIIKALSGWVEPLNIIPSELKTN